MSLTFLGEAEMPGQLTTLLVTETIDMLKRICVFCGSSPGRKPAYARAARELGQLLAGQGIGLVYGGAAVGLMGILAGAAADAGGEVIGIMPRSLVEREVAFAGLDDLRITDTMHERKALMAELADAFIVLPGGLGTLEESFEVLTWSQLGMHAKPCGFLNIDGYFDGALAFLDHAVEECFMEAEHRDMVIVETSAQRLLEAFGAYRPPTADKAQRALRLN
jgi:uncharacterized protein (TIGR00730 family)